MIDGDQHEYEDEWWILMNGGWWHQHPKTWSHLIFGWIHRPQVLTYRAWRPSWLNLKCQPIFTVGKRGGMELKMFSLLRSSWFFRNPTTQNMKFKLDHGVQKVSKYTWITELRAFVFQILKTKRSLTHRFWNFKIANNKTATSVPPNDASPILALWHRRSAHAHDWCLPATFVLAWSWGEAFEATSMGLVYSPTVWPTSEVNVGTIFTWLENHIYHIWYWTFCIYINYLHLEHLQPNIANVPEQFLHLRHFWGDSLTKLSSPSKIWPPFPNLKS